MAYKPNTLLKLPSLDTKVWRYMDFVKYVSLLKKKALWFCRADKFADNWEGSLSLKTYEYAKKRDKYWGQYKESNEYAKVCGYESYEEMCRVRRIQARKDNALNCWHISNRESVALWEIYSDENGLAICSTTRNLIKAFRAYEDDVYIGKVKYIDYQKYKFPEHETDIVPFYFKRLSYRHERELRLMIQGARGGKFEPGIRSPGISVPVDINKIVKKVFVNPRAPRWFFDLVCTISHQLCVKRNIINQSEMCVTPLY